MTTYTKRTNAKRAAIAAGIPEDQVEITVHKKDGEVRFGFKQKATAVAAAPAVQAAKPAAATKAPTAERERRNGVTRPRAGGACAAVWEALDQMHAAGTVPTPKDAKLWAESVGANQNNAAIEIYGWRKFNGIKKQIPAKKAA